MRAPSTFADLRRALSRWQRRRQQLHDDIAATREIYPAAKCFRRGDWFFISLIGDRSDVDMGGASRADAWRASAQFVRRCADMAGYEWVPTW